MTLLLMMSLIYLCLALLIRFIFLALEKRRRSCCLADKLFHHLFVSLDLFASLIPHGFNFRFGCWICVIPSKFEEHLLDLVDISLNLSFKVPLAPRSALSQPAWYHLPIHYRIAFAVYWLDYEWPSLLSSIRQTDACTPSGSACLYFLKDLPKPPSFNDYPDWLYSYGKENAKEDKINSN
jgi:hypothetical protein